MTWYILLLITLNWGTVGLAIFAWFAPKFTPGTTKAAIFWIGIGGPIIWVLTAVFIGMEYLDEYNNRA